MKSQIENRNQEFRRRCIEIFERDVREGGARPLESVLERALAMQPHSHYLSYDTASRRIHRIHRYGIEKVVKERLAREMWRELVGQIEDVQARFPRKTFDMALTFVLNFYRPSRFYMSLDTARRIVAPNLSYRLTRCA